MWRKLAILRAGIVPIGWLAVVGAGVWGFVTLSPVGEFTDVGTPRTLADKAVPYLFLVLIPVGLYFGWKEFRAALNELPLADAADEKARQIRQRRKEAQSALMNRPPLDEGIKRDAMATVELLGAADVIDAAEIDTSVFLDICEETYIESGDLYEVSGILSLYAEAHGSFANALFIPDQVEVATPDLMAIIEGFARLAGRGDELSDVTLTFANQRKRGSDATARFALSGKTHTLEFEYHSKNAPGSLMEALAKLFDPTPAFVSAYFDSLYLVTRLEDQDCAALNTALDTEYETFQPL